MSTNKSYIEVDFPISRLSKESYKERKAGSGQTLTGMGKWWGRKPLILVRATILGILMPSSGEDEESIKKDREIFLKILTMDDKGLNLRKKGNVKDFETLSYEDKLKYCVRPEEVTITDEKEWEKINNHLNTNAFTLEELIQQLGEKKFGHYPKVGDCFAGGGSIPFEAARIGCDAYASDLNPIACLLNWANLNILSKSNEEIEKLNEFRQNVYDEVERQILKWGIEENENNERAIAYLYCNETICPECGYTIPLTPSWDISTKTNTVAILKENKSNKKFDIEIIQYASKEIQQLSKKQITIKKGKAICPHCEKETSISTIRGDKQNSNKETIYGLRRWENNDIVSREEDIFKERLYCIRYEDKNGNKIYVSPTKFDLKREEKVLKILEEKFDKWQEKGYIPSDKIEDGYNTSQIVRERGWMYWHQLFNPRQLLINGLLAETCDKLSKTKEEKVLGILGINKCCDGNSKLGYWQTNRDNLSPVFYNQALNTVLNYGCRSLSYLKSSWLFKLNNYEIRSKNIIEVGDARNIYKVLLKDARDIIDPIDVWVTDPPYADAVNYDELSEFFLAWDKKKLKEIFSEWYTDSKRALAVRGKGKTFNESMIEVYSNLRENMHDNGYQVVMFTNQDVNVWAELAMVLWKSKLQVVSAWNIATETESGGLKSGNYVKGTVILVLKKLTSDEFVFEDELYPEIKKRVIEQLDLMRGNEKYEENDEIQEKIFEDADYALAGYAAALSVLTSYDEIDGIDLEYELFKEKKKNEITPVARLLQEAKDIAMNYILPIGIEQDIWVKLSDSDRFFIKGLENEKDMNYKISSYQELARGFGIKDYTSILRYTTANKSRVYTGVEFGNKYISEDDNNFSSSLTRHILVALNRSTKNSDIEKGFHYLKHELPAKYDYWNERKTIIAILNYIGKLENVEHMSHWKDEAKMAKTLAIRLNNDGI